MGRRDRLKAAIDSLTPERKPAPPSAAQLHEDRSIRAEALQRLRDVDLARDLADDRLHHPALQRLSDATARHAVAEAETRARLRERYGPPAASDSPPGRFSPAGAALAGDEDDRRRARVYEAGYNPTTGWAT